MKGRKIFRAICRAAPYCLISALFLTLCFYPKPKKEEGEEKRIVTVWNVDTFEGGKGSRTTFLRSVARAAERKGNGVYYLVLSYTAEGANEAYKAGLHPDILSYGVGLSAFAESCVPLKLSFAGGDTELGCLAYPWCRGSYYLFSLTEDFSEEGSTAVSVGGKNLARVCAAYSDIKGEEVESGTAYVGFLSGKYRYLLGTQRDVCRFETRGATVYKKELTAYCDLFQYVSILSRKKSADCELYLNTLLSEETQERLSEIGMSPVRAVSGERTVSVFTSDEALASLDLLAGRGESGKNLDKFTKFI